MWFIENISKQRGRQTETENMVQSICKLQSLNQFRNRVMKESSMKEIFQNIVKYNWITEMIPVASK